jgi:DNA-binding NtrC family response regulator
VSAGAASPPVRLLVVEDRESLRRMMERALTEEGYTVATASDARGGLAALDRPGRFELVLTDLKLPGGSGLDVLAAARRLEPPPAVVVMTGYGTVGAAVEAMKLGAADFLEKPVELEPLLRLVAALSGRSPEREIFEVAGAPAIVGAHPRLRAALRLLERVAPTDSTVLLTGESGTGKELFARALHALSPRRNGPFVAVNCAAIPETLVESELFGHEKGAFTGADRRRPGRFELARGGTLLLDEIGELPAAVQAKVLRVLDTRRFERVGGEAALEANARLVAATNRDLAAMAASGDFRSDLLYRLEIFPIALPALRERASDLPRLARHLLAGIATRLRSAAPELGADAESWLERQPWPGNVRQLANLLERAAIVHGSARLGAAELERLANRPTANESANAEVAEGEAAEIRRALVESAGDKQEAAKRLGISYRTLLRRIDEHDLRGFPKYRP